MVGGGLWWLLVMMLTFEPLAVCFTYTYVFYCSGMIREGLGFDLRVYELTITIDIAITPFLTNWAFFLSIFEYKGFLFFHESSIISLGLVYIS
ncbi:hypothetical protein QBC38DRAFT_182108 [Podospora fimiseda]|uniref:Uncharacterized protein n=1 Tax=Podospora fimiseda TaxID=252190 RepID=A0AAN7H379_9PEZI|nr:hypothetical protein QBC38DRAFT_182108 [Podospora fimiseda]